MAQVRTRGEDLPSRELAGIMRAFANARRRPLRTFDAVAAQLGTRADSAPPGVLATLLWALAKASYPAEPSALAPVAEALAARAEEFPGRDLATALWAMTQLTPEEGRAARLLALCGAVEAELDARRAAFNRMDMRMVCTAFEAAEYRLPVVCKEFLDKEAARQRARKARSRGKQRAGGKAASPRARAAYKQKGLSRG